MEKKQTVAIYLSVESLTSMSLLHELRDIIQSNLVYLNKGEDVTHISCKFAPPPRPQGPGLGQRQRVRTTSKRSLDCLDDSNC
eukprot:3049140-Amphidinium_carterae.1